MTAPQVPLNDGHCIPAVGFGVFKVPPADTEQAVGTALRAGYRHIDTAAMYQNERETGRVVAESGVPRNELYLVTKLWNADQGYDSTLAAFDASGDGRLSVSALTQTIKAGSVVTVLDSTGATVLQGTFATVTGGHGGRHH